MLVLIVFNRYKSINSTKTVYPDLSNVNDKSVLEIMKRYFGDLGDDVDLLRGWEFTKDMSCIDHEEESYMIIKI